MTYPYRTTSKRICQPCEDRNSLPCMISTWLSLTHSMRAKCRQQVHIMSTCSRSSVRMINYAVLAGTCSFNDPQLRTRVSMPPTPRSRPPRSKKHFQAKLGNKSGVVNHSQHPLLNPALLNPVAAYSRAASTTFRPLSRIPSIASRLRTNQEQHVLHAGGQIISKPRISFRL